MMGNVPVFEKESEMYLNILPEFEKIFKENGRSVKFGARCYKTTSSPNTIVLEDLKPKGFFNINRMNGMDMVQTKAALDKLAQFHAVSACFVEKNGPFRALFNDGMFPPQMVEVFNGLLQNFWTPFSAAMKQWEGLEEYVEKIVRISISFFFDYFNIKSF